MRTKYVPRNYKQQLCLQWGTLRQDHKSVSKYIQEWEKLSVISESNETEEMRVGKFVGGLREELRMKLEMMPNLTFSLVCSTALTLENYSKKKSNSSNNYPRNFRNINPRKTTNSTPIQAHNQTPASNMNQTTPMIPRNRNTNDLKGVVCFKCHGHGHIKSECPNAKAFTIQEWDVIKEMSKPKAMFVNKNGKEEMVGPCTASDDPDGTYLIGDDGEVEPLEDTDLSEEEEGRETVYPEHES